MITPVCQSFGVFQVSTPPDTPLSINVIVLRSMASTFQVGFSFAPAAFPDFNPRMAAANTVNVKTSTFPKSIELFLLGSTNLQSILFNVKGFPSHPGDVSS